MISLYDIPAGCICRGDGLLGMRCDAPQHATLKLQQGDKAWVRDPQTMAWREAILHEHKPYGSRGRRISDGWYIRWCGDVKDWESSGGWASIANISKDHPA